MPPAAVSRPARKRLVRKPEPSTRPAPNSPIFPSLARNGAPVPERFLPDRPSLPREQPLGPENFGPFQSQLHQERAGRASNPLRPQESASFPVATPRCETARYRSPSLRPLFSQSRFVTKPLQPASPHWARRNR